MEAVYLKTRGINPAEHPVTAELERVKGYYVKLRRAEDPNYDKRTSCTTP
jgi:exosome complex protein LRP1